MERLEGRVLLSTVAVTTIADASDANLATVTIPQLAYRASNPDGKVSLREAIRAAKNTSGADTVDVPAGTYPLNGTELLYDAASASNAVTIRTTGAAGSTVIDAGGKSRVMRVSSAAPVTLSGLTLRNGGKVDRGGGVSNTGAGALTLTGCTVTANQAVGPNGVDGDASPDENGGRGGDARGGGIFNTGSLTLTACTVSGNVATGGRGGKGVSDGGSLAGRGGDALGGGVHSAGKLTVTDTTLTGNRARGGAGGSGIPVDTVDGDGGDGAGGGAYVVGSASFTGSTVSANLVGSGTAGDANAGRADGGGVYNAVSATLTLTRCTVSGNTAGADTPVSFVDHPVDARGGGAYNAGALTLADTTVSGNHASGGTGATTDFRGRPGTNGLGGGVFNADTGTLALTRGAVTSNGVSGGSGGTGLGPSYQGDSGSGFGGGVYNLHIFTAADSTLSGNAANRGGGVYNAASMTVSRSTLSGNRAVGLPGEDGGGFTPNGATGDEGVGGGIYNAAPGTAALVNSTLSGNRAEGGLGGNSLSYEDGGAGGDGLGGAVANDGGTMSITSSTVAGNEAVGGSGGAGGPGDEINPAGAPGPVGKGFVGGIYNTAAGGTVRLANTIVAGNAAPTADPDVRGAFASGPTGQGGFNLVGNVGGATGFAAAPAGAAPGDYVGGNGRPAIDPKLGPLADNGGPTRTMTPQPGSPAINAGSNALAVGPGGTPLATDQRGQPRIVNGRVDVGAFEVQAQQPPPGSVLAIDGTAGSNRITVTQSGTTLTANVDGRVFTLSTVGKSRLVVRGLGGNDSLRLENSVTMGATLDGGEGDDRLHGGSGRDEFIGGPGDDAADFSDTTTGISVSLDDVANDGPGGGDNVRSDVEIVLGGSGNDTLTGSGSANLLAGNGGNDTLRGGGARDVLIGGAGGDSLFGDDFDDLLIGSRTIYEAGADTSPLRTLLREWRSTAFTYTQRVSRLLAGTPGVRVSASTVPNDVAADVLTGGANVDWFVTQTGDTLADRATTETVTRP